MKMHIMFFFNNIDFLSRNDRSVLQSEVTMTIISLPFESLTAPNNNLWVFIFMA